MIHGVDEWAVSHSSKIVIILIHTMGPQQVPPQVSGFGRMGLDRGVTPDHKNLTKTQLQRRLTLFLIMLKVVVTPVSCYQSIPQRCRKGPICCDKIVP